MNKIQLIDLLDKIANGEEIPQQIKFHNMIWYKSSELSYCEDYYSETLGCYLFYNRWALTHNLNGEVEIIEEEKKIPEKLKIVNFERNYEYRSDCEQSFQDIVIKINEIIDYINGDKE